MAVSSPVRCSSHSTILRMRLRRADLKHTRLNFYLITIERPRGWTAQHLAVNREIRCMAGTDKRVGSVVPVVGAAEMRTIGRKGDHLVIGLLHDPGGGLLGNQLPAVGAGALEGDLGRLAGGDACEIGSLHPLAGFACFRWNQ